jgi:hypothetical protein
MLRRRLFALLLCLVAAGLPLAAEAALSGTMQADHGCMHEDGGNPADCGATDLTANACAMHCAAGACVISNVCGQQLAVPSLPPPAREAIVTADCRSAPETAPPKPALS